MRPQVCALSSGLLLLGCLGLRGAASDLAASNQTPASKQQDARAPRALESYYFQPELLMRDASLLSTRSAPAAGASSSSDGGGQSGGRKSQPRRHLRVVTLETPPFMMKRKPVAPQGRAGASNGSAVEWHGYCMDFFKELVKQLPYEVTYEIYEVADGKFGSKTREITLSSSSGGGDNRTQQQRAVKVEYWNGMMRELELRRAHLALAPLAVMAERELVVDFTVPFYDLVGIQILLKRPEVAQNWFKFLTVLDNDVWLSITLAYFVTSLIIYLFDRLSPYSHKNQRRRDRLRERASERRAVPLQEKPPFVLGSSSLASAGGVAPLSTAGRLESSLLLLPTSGGGHLPALIRVDRRGASHGGNRRRASQDYLQSLWPPFGPSGGAQQEDEEEEPDPSEPDFSLRDSLWFCITSLTPQGGGEAPQNLSGRVVAGAWWLFCFIVIASYTANLAAFLTVSRLDIPIESLDDLAKQYRIKYAPIDGTAERSFFERMAYIEEIFYNIWKEMSLNDSLSEDERSKFSVWDYPISDKFTKIWAQIREVQMPATLEQALARVAGSTLDDGFALLANANMIRWATMTDCSFKAVGEEFSRKPIALALAKGLDQLRDDMSHAILQLINKRYMEVLRERWWTNNPNRVACEHHDESEGISVENIGGVFIIILAGALLSFLVWAVERLAYGTKLEVSRELLEMSRGGQVATARGGRSRPDDQARRPQPLRAAASNT